MEKVNINPESLIPSNTSLQTQESHGTSLSASDEAGARLQDRIDFIFVKFSGVYGTKFTAAVPTEDRAKIWKATWKTGLKSLSDDELRAGLVAALRTCDWPPSLVEFYSLCKPKPDYEQLFVDAVECLRTGEWRGARLYWCAQKFGVFDLRTATWGRASKRWTALVDESWAMQEVPPVPPKREALPDAGRAHDPAVAAGEMEKIRAIIHKHNEANKGAV